MTPTQIIGLIATYFIVLIIISYLTGKEDSNAAFFKANKSAPWYLVAFGMIGASLSGVTFISVPGLIKGQQFAYMQGVFGFFVGYLIVAFVLLPLYYKMNVTSIYEYLEERFGTKTYKTGAFFFLLSRVTGAAFRLFLVALAMQYIVFESIGVPFWLTVVISISMIWLYTNKGGIKTIIWTDTLQTLAMLTCVIVSIVLIVQKLDGGFSDIINDISFKEKSKIFFFEDFNSKIYFWKYFIGGAFITIAMTGLDQDMMQKNLACKNTKEAKKNMLSMSFLLVIVNLVFLTLGALLFIYSEQLGISIPTLDGKERTDLLFPEIAMNQKLGTGLAITFIIGLIAAAYSSADSALTSLTTSFSIDFLDIKNKPIELQKPIRKKTHIGVSLVLIIVVLIFNTLDGSVVSNLFTFATFTYGPLLGLFAFGILTKRQIKDQFSWIVGLASIGITYFISQLPKDVIGDYLFHWELLPINGLITIIGLFIISNKNK
ncbi:sodium:solute symporter [Aurantibacter sp.]|uniref:sodium:solute symporter n=1 Tax=Aurantibacter sp. TaxID=2807103 RepID=UPI0035C86C07